MELYEKQNIKAMQPSSKDIRRLEKLKKKATSDEPLAAKVRFDMNTSDVGQIEQDISSMKQEGVFDRRVTGLEIQKMQADHKKAEDDAYKRMNTPTIEDMMHKSQGGENFTIEKHGKKYNM